MKFNSLIKFILSTVILFNGQYLEGRSGEVENVLHIRDFGGFGNDDVDDCDALTFALNRAKELSPSSVTIQFDAGVYDFGLAGDEASSFHILINDAENLTLRGLGFQTELRLRNSNASGLVINNSKNVTVEGLSLDYQPLPYTQGVIISVNEIENTFDIKIDEGFNSPLHDNLLTAKGRKTRGYLFSPKSNKLTTRFSDQYPVRIDGVNERKLSRTKEGNFRFYSVNTVLTDFIGHKIVVVGRSRHDAMKITQSSNINVKNVDIYSSPSTGFKILNSVGKTTIKNSRIIPKPGSDRLLSTNADGLHAKFNRAPIALVDSRMESMGDDGVNIGGAYQGIYKQLSDNVLLVEPHKTLTDGDTVTITNTADGNVKAVAIIDKVERVTWEDNDALKLTLRSSVGSVRSISDVTESKYADIITSINTTGQNSIILNNQFRNIRGRGIMLHGEYSIVKSNTFSGFRGPGIVIGPDFWWGESSSGSHSVIRENNFNDIYWNNIIIHGGENLDKVEKGSTTDIVIANNTFKNFGRPNPIKGRGEVGPALFISNASKVKVSHNRFGYHFQKNYNGPLVILEMASDIDFFENSFEFTNDNWIEYRNNVDQESITIN